MTVTDPALNSKTPRRMRATDLGSGQQKILGNDAASSTPAADVVASSWDPIDVIAARDAGPPTRATILHRDDGAGVLYPEKLHLLYGKPGVGKGWLALAACVEQLAAGNAVAYFDFEDDAKSIGERLAWLGVADESVRSLFVYVKPCERFDELQAVRVSELVASLRPTLVVIDGLTEAMSLDRLDPLSSLDVSVFYQNLPRRCRQYGAAVAMLDHVVKSKEARAEWAFGAQHKISGVDVAYAIERLAVFTKGSTGRSKIVVAKDRPGHVAGLAAGGKMGEFVLTSDADGFITDAGIRAPATDSRPTALMEKVSQCLEQADEPMTLNQLRDAVDGRQANRTLAIRLLVQEGFVSVEHKGQSRLHRSIRPFRQSGTGPLATP